MKKIVPNDAVLIPAKAGKVFSGQIFDVYQWQQELFDGSTTTFEMLRRPDTVVVIGVVEDHIIVIEDMQPNKTKISFPGGRVERDGSVIQAGQRELHEETGYLFKNWKLVDVFQPLRKIEHFVYVLVASELDGHQEAHPDGGEKITVKAVPYKEAKQMVSQDRHYLGNARHLFEQTDRAAGLLALPEFQGKEIDR